MLLAGRKAGLSLASFPIELKTIFLGNDAAHSGLHFIVSISNGKTPPTDQFKLDNVSIKILSPENSIFCQSGDQTRTSFFFFFKPEHLLFSQVQFFIVTRMYHAASGEGSSVGVEWRRMRKMRRKRMVANVSICIWKALT